MNFGRELRRIRDERNVSQHKLAGATGVSQRHISYLEQGKSKPSRGMVILLARALSAPGRQQNQLLLSAGFAPAFTDEPFEAPAFAKAREAMAFVLERHDPCPALALDRTWKVLAANRGMNALIGFLASGDPKLAVHFVGTDYLEALVAEQGLSQYVTGAERIVCNTLETVHREAIASGDEALRTRVERMLSRYDRAAALDTLDGPSALPGVEFVRDGVHLNFLSIMVAFTTPCAVELASFRMEVLYPADDHTQNVLGTWREAPGFSE
jgi:transcriptional regulator with XRE-family HTH domain